VPREVTQAKLDRRSAIAGKYRASSGFTMADLLEQRTREHGQRPLLHCGERSWSYAQGNAEANRVAHALRSLGIRRGDVVALAMENRPEFFFTWFGLAKLGAVVAFLNTHIGGRALAHALQVTGAGQGGDRRRGMPGRLRRRRGARPSVPLWRWPDAERPASDALRALARRPRAATPRAAPTTATRRRRWRAGLSAGQTAVYIFTSGTTGLPKAAIISHARWLMTGEVMAGNDGHRCRRLLLHLPAAVPRRGVDLGRRDLAVRRRRAGAAAQVQPARVLGRRAPLPRHRLPVRRRDLPLPAVRTGARRRPPAQPAQDGRRGFVGRDLAALRRALRRARHLRRLGRHRGECQHHQRRQPRRLLRPHALLGQDQPAAGALRRRDRLAPARRRRQVDRALPTGRSRRGHRPRSTTIPTSSPARFEGYTSAAATESKLLRDVFEPGDAWWSSGDLLRYDEDGYCWFVDRIGDTFRWKSENVSTTEVGDAFADLDGVESVTVYGVQVPGTEGRAGMAAVVMQDGRAFDASAFYERAAERLPRYAMPMFVRVPGAADMTTTYKLRKVDLQRQGYDAAQVADPLYVRDDTARRYVPLTPEAVQRALAA
jgi:fatty-acyl-CoA synthase